MSFNVLVFLCSFSSSALLINMPSKFLSRCFYLILTLVGDLGTIFPSLSFGLLLLYKMDLKTETIP